jgi:hypothetical protein
MGMQASPLRFAVFLTRFSSGETNYSRRFRGGLHGPGFSNAVVNWNVLRRPDGMVCKVERNLAHVVGWL